MTKILLTGASGFVGSHVLRHLLTSTDWQIVAPVSFRHKGLSDRLVSALDGQDWSRVDIVTVDLTAPISSLTALKFGSPDYILNVASESHVDRSIDEPADFIHNNVQLITSLLDYARTLPNLRAFLQVSTDEVYGPAQDGEAHREWVDVIKPSNPYSASKAAQEAIAFSYWRTYDVPLIVSNTMNIIGETQDTEKFFPKTLQAVLAGEEVQIHASPDGKIGSRFYLHARNQADGLLHLLRKVEDLTPPLPVEGTRELESLRYSGGGTVPPRYHIVGEREVDNLELANMIADAANKPLHYKLVDFHSSRPGHDLRYALDGNKIKSIGWAAPLPLDASVKSIVDWTMAHPEWLTV